MKKNFVSTMLFFLLIGVLTVGCSSIPDRQTISAKHFPSMQNSKPRSSLEKVNYTKLRKDSEPAYILDSGDVLGIYITGITGNPEVPPPIHNVTDLSKNKPAQGYPYQVREDGTVSLPMATEPILVAGMTLIDAENAIKAHYMSDNSILLPGASITVSLIRPRTYNVIVIREDIVSADLRNQVRTSSGIGESYMGSIERGAAYSLELPADKNDVLEALSQTGGMPGLNAKNEVIILRNQFLKTDFIDLNNLNPNMDIKRIPLRVGPHDPLPVIHSEDVTLWSGDVVYIPSRDAEIFYTGGMIKGGVYPLPRDYDLDVLGAIATAGGSVGAAAGSSSGYSAGSKVGTVLPPSRVLIIREINGRQFAIKMRQGDLLKDPSQRILIEPNDVVILEYTNFELIFNIIFSTLTFRVDTLFD
ncbi:MAG: polysaccharide biosynthesis/export family protein [Planctomycetia bacterium]|nr:polysaccharide biosynthesis/export family protein [Planctomycetia bacterium]